jgi:hypothetical protein
VHLKQKGNINDYTHKWEVLATRQCGFTDEQLIKMYICGLKDYIRSEINKPAFTSPERLNKYSDDRTKKYTTDKPNKYLPPHLREGQASHQDSNKKWESKCRYCGDKWSPGHKCNNKKLYSCKAEK